MRTIWIPNDDYTGCVADVRIKRDGDVIAIYNGMRIRNVLDWEEIEQLADNFDYSLWKRIRNLDNPEAKKILMDVADELQKEYLRNEEY